MSASGPVIADDERDAHPGVWSGLSPLVWAFMAIALLALPLFAHGCHGDDVDHEPLLIPIRLNPENR